MLPPSPVVKDVVLLGGGHSHVEVLRAFGMKPLGGARLTLITKDVQTPYSGMLPGYVSGFYSYEDVHIDLRRLARFAQSRLIHAEAIGLDIKKQEVLLRDRPPIKYDVLSIDIGSSPDESSVPGARQFTTAVKPISTFIERLQSLLKTVKQQERPVSPLLQLHGIEDSTEKRIHVELRRQSTERRRLGERGFCVAIVGGGAGGVELAFAMKYRLLTEAEKTNQTNFREPVVKIISKRHILEHYVPSVRKQILTLFSQKGIEAYENDPVVEVAEGSLTLESGALINFDGCLWCTQAKAAQWLASTEMWTDERGFIRINDFLQPFNGPAEIFAAGDTATSVSHPRPKAGVFAVRQGPPLAGNIRRFLQGEELIPFIPQSTYLSLISTGNKSCVANKGKLYWQGPSMWLLKDRIDRAFMYKYGRDLPDMEKMKQPPALPSQLTASNLLEKQAALLLDKSKKRCAGCGGKIGMCVLRRVLTAIGSPERSTEGFNTYDDAAVLQPPKPGHLMLQTTDFLRSFVSDPYIFGQITALHCIADVYAMGGQPTFLLATAVVPFGTEEKMESDLIQVMLGAKKVCDEAECVIAGGHTAEGTDMYLGFTVTGTVVKGNLLTKAGAGLDQSIILTKPLGCGMIFAAEMRGKAKAPWIEAALESMLTSNRSAVGIFQQCGAIACTDVSGFGLLGHLSEMLADAKVSVELDLEAVPMLPGTEECSKSGWLSSLHPQNSRMQKLLENYDDVKLRWETSVLADPQTSGGLLAFVPEANAARCVEALRASGSPSAAVIGYTFKTRRTSSPKILLRHFGDY